MKGFAGLLAAATLSAVLGTVVLFAGFYQQALASADQVLADTGL